jgi:FtsP/CotA-like multicopper oxidase with cupredoxin domain
VRYLSHLASKYTCKLLTHLTPEYWLSVEHANCAPDGYQRVCQTFNGTVPGPAIVADWGDTLVIHVTNNLQDNGTSIHWHGLRMLGSVEQDGVPGVTQCPIPPGESLTYRFRVTQYGSTWYHSHYSLQYAEGLLGPLILNGPTTANYDEDLGMLFLQDWSHIPAFTRWPTARLGAPPALENTLINGSNIFDCSTSTDAACIGGGKKFEMTFEAGKKYRIRLINVAIDGQFQFSIDGHTMTVISNDLVPIVPYQTDIVKITIGQRYDVIVEANQGSGDFWIRGGWNPACNNVQNAANATAILRYDSSSTSDPTTTSSVTISSSCGDEDPTDLVPYLPVEVTKTLDIITQQLSFTFDSYFKWTIDGSSLYLNMSDPTLLQIFEGDTSYPTSYNVYTVDVS